MGRGRGGQLKEAKNFENKKVRQKTISVEKKLDLLYTSFEKRLSNLEELYKIAGDRVPATVLPPSFYKDWPNSSPLEKFFLSYDRSRLDRALGLTIMNLNKAFVNKKISEVDYKKAAAIYFSDVEKERNNLSIQALKENPIWNNKEIIKKLKEFNDLNQFCPEIPYRAAALAEHLSILKGFPNDSMQQRVYKQIVRRLENRDDIPDSENIVFLAEAAKHAAHVIASGIDPLSQQKQVEYEQAAEAVSKKYFNKKAKVEFVIPIPNSFMISVNSKGEYDKASWVGSIGRNIPFFQESIYINTSLNKADVHSDEKEKLNYLLVHETVHSTQCFDDLWNKAVISDNQIAILEGVTEIETADRIKAQGESIWFENKMKRKLTTSYKGYQYLIREALENNNPDKKEFKQSDYRFLLEDPIKAEIFLAEALFGKIQKKIPEKTKAKAGTKERLQEHSVQVLRLSQLIQNINKKTDELNLIEDKPENVQAWIKKEVAALKQLKRTELESLLEGIS